MSGVAWIVPTVEDLKAYQVAAALTAYRTAALGSGQADPFDEALYSVTNRIRDEIRSCRSNVVSDTPMSIPPGLKWIACLLIVQELEGRLPGVRLTEAHKTRIEDGLLYLRRIAKCEVIVDLPDDVQDPSTAQSGTVGTLISSRTRTATRSTLAGL